MRKFHKLLHGEGALYAKLLPTADQEKALRDAKNTIKKALIAGIKHAATRELGMEREVEPRFRTQGSWAYGACVQPAHQPPQEMDWDYGVYLPVTMLDDKVTPKVAARAYFDVVEGILTQLAKQQGWTMGKPKERCVRVHVAKWAHVDIALYAAPEDEFEKINDRFVESKGLTFDHAASVSLERYAEIAVEQTWDDFEGMMLAKRDGEWEHSDAEKIAGWFRLQKETHGEQLQRTWRYLKAWRDQQWEEGGPSSVCLMLVATQQFKKFPGRDDLALIGISEHLPSALANDISEDGIDPGHNFNRMSTAERAGARKRAQVFTDELVKARTNILQPKSAVITGLRGLWGSRLPNCEQDIEHNSPAQQVRDTPVRQVAAPVVASSYAG
jgi:hypothetical protein